MNWQPIKTAPKDGRRILGYVQDTIEGRYSDDAQPGPHVLGIKWSERGWEADDWNQYCCGCSADVVEPTHWMPLPEPPE